MRFASPPIRETSLSSFETCIIPVLQHEGFLSDDKADSGGITKYGISLAYLLDLSPVDGDINRDGKTDSQDIRSLTLDRAKELYKHGWWDKYGYDAIQDIRVATKVLDLAVNMGASQAHKLVQRAVGVKDDGILGADSLRAINAAIPDKLLSRISDQAMTFYVDLTFTRISKMGLAEGGKFLKGWLRRAYDPIEVN